MNKIALAAMVSLGMVGTTGLALAAVPPIGSGPIYTDALNIMSSKGYHDFNLISQKGDVVHATAMTRANKSVSLSVNTANGTINTMHQAMSDPPVTATNATKKEASAVKHETTAVKHETSATRKEASAVKHETTAAKHEASATRKEASAVKPETSTAKKANEAAKTEHSTVKKTNNTTHAEHSPVKKEASK